MNSLTQTETPARHWVDGDVVLQRVADDLLSPLGEDRVWATIPKSIRDEFAMRRAVAAVEYVRSHPNVRLCIALRPEHYGIYSEYLSAIVLPSMDVLSARLDSRRRHSEDCSELRSRPLSISAEKYERFAALRDAVRDAVITKTGIIPPFSTPADVTEDFQTYFRPGIVLAPSGAGKTTWIAGLQTREWSYMEEWSYAHQKACWRESEGLREDPVKRFRCKPRDVDGDEIVSWPEDPRFWETGNYTPFNDRDEMLESHMRTFRLHMMAFPKDRIHMNVGSDFLVRYPGFATAMVCVSFKELKRNLEARQPSTADTDVMTSLVNQTAMHQSAQRQGLTIMIGFDELEVRIRYGDPAVRRGLIVATMGAGKSTFVRSMAGK